MLLFLSLLWLLLLLYESCCCGCCCSCMPTFIVIIMFFHILLFLLFITRKKCMSPCCGALFMSLLWLLLCHMHLFLFSWLLFYSHADAHHYCHVFLVLVSFWTFLFFFLMLLGRSTCHLVVGLCSSHCCCHCFCCFCCMHIVVLVMAFVVVICGWSPLLSGIFGFCFFLYIPILFLMLLVKSTHHFVVQLWLLLLS